MTSIKLLAAVGALYAVPAGAVTITTIAADFSTPVGGSAIAYQNADGIAGNEILRWGEPATSAGPNSFLFASTATPLTVATDAQFSLGSFTYTNQQTYGTPLTSLRLALTSSISGSASPVTFLFNLGVTETPNAGNLASCPFPSMTPCSDRVTVATLSGSGVFEVGGTFYTLYIDGFRNGGGAFSTEFYGEEGVATRAEVIGRFAEALPEPASWAMLVAGFGLAGGVMRRPRARVRFA